ncbi:MAG: peptidylprolyl isomerase [bacterium]|nr:peptidylprolyl isomerase [bacterium]
MLKFFRQKNIAKIIFWFLVILILPAFVFWGTGSISGSKEKGPKFVGTIDNKKVTFEDLYRALTGIKCQIILNMFTQPERMDALFNNKPFMAKLAWDRLIMLKEAQKYKLNVSDDEVVAFIRSHPVFARNGEFDPKSYTYLLNYSFGLDPRGFEEAIRENLKIKKMGDMLTADLTVNDAEALQEYQKEHNKFRGSYILVDPAKYVSGITIDEAALKNYYDEHRREFILPKKEGAETQGETAKFEDIKESIKFHLTEAKTRVMAQKEAEEVYARISEMTAKDGLSFESASSKLGFEVKDTPLFARSDYLEGLGEAFPLVEKIVRLKPDGISDPVGVRRGIIIFQLKESQSTGEDEFEKAMEEYRTMALNSKRDKFLEEWLRKLEAAATLNIDFEDYEKYFR